jgi:hypothetical protein
VESLSLYLRASDYLLLNFIHYIFLSIRWMRLPISPSLPPRVSLP